MQYYTIITGASSGIGEELAKTFAKNGHHLILIARTTTKLQSLSQMLKETYHINVQYLSLDLSQSTAVNEVEEHIRINNLSIQYLVNNAGLGDGGYFESSDWNKNNQMIQVNIHALTHLCHSMIPIMKKQKITCGILNIASIAAFMPGPMMTVYFATKSYVLNFSLGLREELKETNIYVTAICPGPIATNFINTANVNNATVFNDINLDSPSFVAQSAYTSFINQKSYKIIGIKNKIMVALSKITPDNILLPILKKINQ